MPPFRALFSSFTGPSFSESNVAEDDLVVFVVGATESRRNWFLKELSTNVNVKRHDLICTTYVQAWRFNINLGSGMNSVVFVNTPSFHIKGSDAEVTMTAWIRWKLNKHRRHSFVLFLHSLDPTNHDVDLTQYLDTFAKTFPSTFTPPSRVYVLPTREPASILSNDQVVRPTPELESIITSLDGSKWHASVASGAFTGRKTAGNVVQRIIEDMVNGEPYEIITPSRRSPMHESPDTPATNIAAPIPQQSIQETNNNPNETLGSMRAALQFIPPGHPQRHLALVSLANLLYEQFEKEGKKEDLDEVISLKRAAVELIPSDTPDRVAALAELTNLLSERFRQDGELDEIVMLRRATLELAPPGHPGRRSALIDLADVLFERFRKERTKADLDEIITLRRAAIELTPLGCQDDYATLANFVDFLCERFNEGGQGVELDQIIALRRDLLELVPPGNPQRRPALINLADSLSQRFEKEGVKADLDLTISLRRAALELTPLEDPDRYSALTNLAALLSRRFGKAAPLDEIVTLRRAALDLVPQGHSERCSALLGLADLLSERFRRDGMKADLDETISLQQAALDCMPSEAPGRQSILVKLGDNLYQRFRRDNTMPDLAEVIALQRAVLDMTPGGPHRRAVLSKLTDRLSDRFRIEGKKEDLDEMITLQQAALKSISSGHPDHYSTLTNLADLLSLRFTKEKTKSDLDLIISLRRTALELTPLEGSERHSALNQLVDLLYERFKKDGAKKDLDEIIALTRTLLECMPSGNPERRPTLLEFVGHLSERSKREGATEDLMEIILTQRAVLEVTPRGHPERCTTLSNLASCLSERLKNGREEVDLDEIITLRRLALECLPSRDARKERFMVDLTEDTAFRDAVLALADSRGVDPCPVLSKRTLDETIILCRAALNSVLARDHPGRQPILGKFDASLYKRFRERGDIADMEEIITLRQATLDHTPPLDQGRPLLSLADCYHEKFQKWGSVVDIEKAIELGERAMALCPPGHSDRLPCQECLTCYLTAKLRNDPDPVPPVIAVNPSSDFSQQIRSIVFETLRDVPLRLLYTTTGILCNRDAQLSYFENSPQYSQLLPLISALDDQLREARIREVVSKFFEYVTLSHRWGSREPLLRDIEGTKIYDLSNMDGLAKLQNFCLCALGHGFLWAWSDTCCIDKDSSAELQEAIGSMFSWYRRSSLTLVYLSDVSNACSFADSLWFKRGWTLQELLAPPTVLFYTRDWSLYMNLKVDNHKTNATVLAELQKATGIAEGHLMNFSPGMDDARSRLQWASGRCTTRSEDVAYSLFGIFKLHLPVLYGESAESAIGRLLAEIISRSGDISILDWVGTASSIHSCFPASLTPYQALPRMPSTASDTSRRDSFELEKVRKLYSSLAALPRARFVNQTLTLPSIAHWVTTVKLLRSSTSPLRYVYEIHASHLRPLEVTLSVSLEKTPGIYVLVRPWHPKPLEVTQVNNDTDALWKLAEQLEQPFSAFLLRRLPHNEYRRIASDSAIFARAQDLDSILESKTLIPEIV